jgi:hypothetical protein
MTVLRARCLTTMGTAAMKQIVVAIRITFVLLLLTASRSSATPIGQFSFDVDSGFGPFFTVENTSGSAESGTPPLAFTNVVIHLFSSGIEVFPGMCCHPGDISFFGPLVLDPSDPTNNDVSVDPPGRSTLFTDLTAFTFDSATLSFGFALPGTFRVDGLDPDGLTIDGLAGLMCDIDGCAPRTDRFSAAIEFTPAATDGSPVPEPATLLLVGTGLWVSVRRRISRPCPGRPPRSTVGTH